MINVKGLFRSRKAVSSVLGAVLMMLIVMTGMSILFGFFVSYAGDFRAGAGSAVLESIMVEDVWINGGSAEVWVYNTGKVNFTIASVYVDGKLTTSPNLNIAPGEHGSMSVLLSGNAPYLLKIVTTRGTSLEGRYA